MLNTAFSEQKMSNPGISSLASPRRRLEGKVAIITGGASGIGASTARLFHENGAKVVIADIQDSLGQAIADKLGENAFYIHCDVSNEDDVSNVVDTTISKHGKLDIMYNNAGVFDRPLGSILETTKSDLDLVVGVNLVGALLGAKHAARVMIPQRKGCIIFTASATTAVAGMASHAYTASKYGIVGLAKNLAAELGQYSIRVNCVSPFIVATPMSAPTEGDVQKVEAISSAVGNLKGKVLKAEGVAQAALYLASDDANYVSGVNLILDGGFSIVNPTMMNAFNLVP
ncbi:tropinone reductase-like 1 [Durio zibethinus]|uniref:Tropinone reductase-like 1 n=1 Tax=Durio zibethinus TaxID=66656 RepID=A0A6P6AMH1_DURZI|nr:tropinone reductase-like 1 [Durio zibethinus]